MTATYSIDDTEPFEVQTEPEPLPESEPPPESESRRRNREPPPEPEAAAGTDARTDPRPVSASRSKPTRQAVPIKSGPIDISTSAPRNTSNKRRNPRTVPGLVLTPDQNAVLNRSCFSFARKMVCSRGNGNPFCAHKRRIRQVQSRFTRRQASVSCHRPDATFLPWLRCRQARNTRLFSRNWGFKKLPPHVTAVPMIINNRFEGLFLCVANEPNLPIEALEFVEKIADKTVRQLEAKENPFGVAA